MLLDTLQQNSTATRNALCVFLWGLLKIKGKWQINSVLNTLDLKI